MAELTPHFEVHTITRLTLDEVKERGIPLSMHAARFAMFIATRDLSRWATPGDRAVEEHATAAGFTVTRIQSLQPHYARTLDTWAQALDARRDDAIAIQSEEVYDRYMKYLTGCADMFRNGYVDVSQFTLRK